MVDEHLFVQEILRKHDVSVSQLAERAGLADSTVYEYTGGRKKTIPIDLWRALFELTQDVRILQLVTGSVETFVAPIPHISATDATSDALRQLIDKRRKDIECEMAILTILSDGKIDRKDWQAIEQYRDAHPESLKLSVQIYRTITRKFEETTGRHDGAKT